MKLEIYLRDKLYQEEQMHNYGVSTDTVRVSIDEYNEIQNFKPIKQ